jgi:hypothetical protein
LHRPRTDRSELDFWLAGHLVIRPAIPNLNGRRAFAGDRFPTLGAEQSSNICGAGSTIPWLRVPAGTLVTTYITSLSGSSHALSDAGIAKAAGVVGYPKVAATFVAPASAGGFDPVDSIDGKTPVDFEFISGNLGRNAGQSVPLYRFRYLARKRPSIFPSGRRRCCLS